MLPPVEVHPRRRPRGLETVLGPVALALTLACARPGPDATSSPDHCPPRASASDPGEAGRPLLLRDVRIVDVRGSCSLGEPTDIAIADAEITAIGPDLDPPPGARIIEEPELVVLPGFVDTHTHLWQHVAKGLASQSELQGWVDAVYALAPYLSAADIEVLTEAGAREATLSGVTSLIDFTIDYHGGQLPGIAAGLHASGVGGAFIAWKPGLFLPPEAADRYLDELQTLAGGGLELRVGFGPLSFFPVSTVHDGVVLARRNGLRVTEHTTENLQEQRDLAAKVARYLDEHAAALDPDDRALLESVRASSAEIPADPRLADVRRYVDNSPRLDAAARAALEPLGTNRWRTSVPIVEQLGGLDGLFVAIHSVWTSPEDLEIFARRGVVVSHNPESNMYLASGVAPILAYLEAGVPVSLGTDGAASNDRIDMFDAMRGVAALQKVRELDAQAPSACEVLKMATQNGALALARDDLGAVAVGMQADLVVLSRARLGLASAADEGRLLSGLVYSATARDVSYVIADGVVLVEHGALVGVDEIALAERVRETVRTVSERARMGARYDRAWLERSRQLSAGAWWSVRAADEVALELAAAEHPRRLQLVFSGTLLGGDTPFTMAPEALARFPATAPPRFDELELEVPANATVKLTRPANHTQWTIRVGDDQRERAGEAAEQITLRWL
jgi:5-methylthioadenosine/S-adenosylhomocysteine deaminase